MTPTRSEHHPDTEVARVGHSAGSGPATPSIHPSSAQAFPAVAALESAYAGGLLYIRNGNQNARDFAAAVARLEGAAAGAAVSSGQAATLAALLAVTPPGGTILIPPDVYGGTHAIVRRRLPALGFRTRPWNGRADTLGELEPGTTVVCETISNPLMRASDIGALASACRGRGASLVVDNTFATPLLCRPLAMGATVVLHSATKFLNGHGDVMAGVVVGPAELIDRVVGIASDLGSTLAPLDAWLALRGMRTMHLRVERQAATAERLAGWLKARPEVENVYHPSRSPLPEGLRAGGPMLSFVLRGGGEAVARLVRAMPGIPLVPTLGDIASTVSIPILTSHRDLAPEDQAATGVVPGMVRLSVGTEDPGDLEAELDIGLRATAADL